MGYVCQFCLTTLNTSHNFCRLSRARISVNGWKIQPLYLFLKKPHDALVCRVASTTEKTWLQTTRDQHMHPSVRMCVLACKWIHVKVCGCGKNEAEKVLSSYLRLRNVQSIHVRVRLCCLLKVLGMHRSAGSEQRMQLEAWPSVQHKTNNL